MLNINSNSNISGVRKSGIPFKDDLNTWHKGISSYDFTEINGILNAKVLPRVALFNGINNYLYDNDGDYITGSQDIDISAKFSFSLATGNKCVWSCGGFTTATPGITLYISDRIIRILTCSNAGTISIVSFGIYNIDTLYDVRVVWSGITGETLTITINGSDQTTTSTLGWTGNSVQKLMIGAYRIATPISFFKGNIYEVSVNSTHKYYLNGLGSYEYNIVDTPILTWYGTARVVNYSLDGSTFAFKNGYKIYKKSGELDEYVLQGASPNDLITAGYSLTEHDTYEGSLTSLNMFPSMIDFDPNNTSNILLINFNRSNTTIHSALSRSSSDYNATYPYRISITNIADPRIYTEFLNIGYAGKLAGKITTQLSSGTYYIKSYKEQLNYATDKTGGEQLSVMNYCGTNVFSI